MMYVPPDSEGKNEMATGILSDPWFWNARGGMWDYRFHMV